MDAIEQNDFIENIKQVFEEPKTNDFIEKNLNEAKDIKQFIGEPQNKPAENDQYFEKPVSISESLSAKDFLCAECGKSFPSKYLLHMHTSYMHKIEVCVCPTCGNEFQNKVKLHQHINCVHKDRNIQCEMCSKLFKNKSLLYGHKKIVHEVIENLSCPNCGIKVMNTYKLKNHLKRFCLVKGYEKSLSFHNPILINPTCKECNKTFKTNHALNRHRFLTKYGHFDVIKCQICNQNYKHIPSFKRHLRVGHKINDNLKILALIKEVKPEFETRKKKEKKNVASGLTAYQKQREDLVQKWKEIEKEQNALKKPLNKKIQCDKSVSNKEKQNISVTCTCPFCGHNMDNKSYFKEHIKQFHGDVSKTKNMDNKDSVKCPTCGIEVMTANKLKKHMKKFCRGYKQNNLLLEEFSMTENETNILPDMEMDIDVLQIKTEEFVQIKSESNDENQNLGKIIKVTKESEKDQSLKSEGKREPERSVVSEDEPQSCPYCEGTELNNKTYLMMHLNKFHEDQPQSCPYCEGTELKNKFFMIKHLNRFHDGYNLPEDYKIEDEYQNINTNELLDGFFNTGENECNEEIKSENNAVDGVFNTTKNVHNGLMNSENKSEKAKDEYENKYQADQLNGIVNTGKTEHNDIITNENQPKKIKLDQTKDAEQCNDDNGDFICSECGNNFGSNETFLDHICETNPIEDKCESCPNCGKEFKNIEDLKIHQTTETKCLQTDTEGSVKCELCRKTYKSKLALHQHTNYAHSTSTKEKCTSTSAEVKLLFCSLCGKEFKNTASLRQHQKKTIGCSQSGPESYVECPLCGKDFVNKHALYSHNYTVHTIENVNCPNCGKTCKNKVALNLHIRRNCGSYIKTEEDAAPVQGVQGENTSSILGINSPYF